MKKIVDLTQWHRRDHFQLFRQFEEPFFGVTIRIDCTRAYELCKQRGHSFFLYYLYQSLWAANQLPCFKYRIDGDQLVEYDVVHASPTINRPDGSFGFAYMDYYASFDEFVVAAKAETERVRNSTGLVPSSSGQNVIHYSAMPWLDFTSVSHARSFSINDSCPKITFGKMTEQGGRKTMPVAIHVHHALMDGYDVSRLVELFQQAMDQ